MEKIKRPKVRLEQLTPDQVSAINKLMYAFYETLSLELKRSALVVLSRSYCHVKLGRDAKANIGQTDN